MIKQEHIIIATASAGILIVLLIVLLLRVFCWSEKKYRTEAITTSGSLQDGIAILHQQKLSSKRKAIASTTSNFYNKIRRGSSISDKVTFKWSDHPLLIAEVVENGWSRFSFTSFISSLSSSAAAAATKPSILALCKNVGECYERDADDIGVGVGVGVETSWEVCNDSTDYLQKIRLNYSSTLTSSTSVAATSVIKTALPLPGPVCSFPQEAYFEIKILGIGGGGGGDEFVAKVSKEEGEKVKLIEEKSVSDVVVVDELKINVKEDGGRNEVAALCLGLASGGGCGGGGSGSASLKLPGSYQGSIGFNSNGSVYLDGTKLVYKTGKDEWGIANKVIGCGFDPRLKNVFFTIDSQLVHVIHCKSEEYGTPMYPTLAANGDITVLVNFGQSVFEYEPANAQRTPNPCFNDSAHMESRGASVGYEDSKELFSMGRIDEQWLNKHTRSSCNNGSNHNRTLDFDQESETDLFEIVLDSCSGRSPK